MKKLINKIKSLSSETKAGLVLALGTCIIFVSAFALSGGENQPSENISEEITSTYTSQSPSSSEVIISTPIVDVMKEEIIRPYTGNLETIHYFYEHDADVDQRVKSIVKVPGETSTYIKSIGNDYARSDNKDFNVIASVSGTVVDKISDATYGNILIIEHASSIRMIYASLNEMKVNKGEQVNQGDVIATSGSSLYLSDYPSALHFEIIKDGKNINPESVFSKTIKEI